MVEHGRVWKERLHAGRQYWSRTETGIEGRPLGISNTWRQSAGIEVLWGRWDGRITVVHHAFWRSFGK